MNQNSKDWRPIEILLIEDNPGDVDLTKEALHDAKVRNRLNVVDDGAKAVEFLYKRGEYSDAPRPDIILLDLNLPKKDGRQVLKEIKADPQLAQIPVVILTTSGPTKTSSAPTSCMPTATSPSRWISCSSCSSSSRSRNSG